MAAAWVLASLTQSAGQFEINVVPALPLIFKTSNTERMRLDNILYLTGDTYIAGASIATRNSGTIAYFKNNANTGVYLTAGNSAWTAASDERLKTVSGEITGGIEKVKAMRPVNYTLNADSENKQRIGFLAQEMVSVVPEVVEVPETETDEITGDTSYWGIQYAEISVVLTAALKEAITKIETLEAKVQTLENN